tara:strand:+ start:5851 stop:6804 length:954 start_codon:yes stop_codon:yes gene_type:complete
MKRTSWRDKKFVRKFLGLDRNENFDFVLRDRYREFYKCLTPEDIVLYPDLPKAYKALSATINIEPNKLLLCNGSEQGLKILLEYFKLQNCKSLKYWNPTFQMTGVYGEIYSYDCNVTQYTYHNNKFTTATNATGYDVVYIVNPNNPTGTRITNSIVEKLCQHNKNVIVDEAYYEFNNYYTSEHLVDKYDNLYILRTLSKAAGGAGMRIGYIVTQPSNIDCVSLTKPAYEISGVGVKFIQYIYDNPDMIEESVSRLKKAKRQIESKYKCIPCIGNYVLMTYTAKLWNELSKIADVKLIEVSERKFIRMTVTNHKDIIE